MDDLLEKIKNIIRTEIESAMSKDHGEKLISPAEACRLFVPAISKVTCSAWTRDGHLKDYRIGGRVYYRYSEIIEAAKTLKKYKV